MRLKQFFETHAVFRYEDLAEFMVAQGKYRRESWQQQLNYHKKAGHIIHIRKFLYAVKPLTSQDYWVDPYLIASKAAGDAVIAYHTALELHNIAYSTFSELVFLTNRRMAPFSYEAQRYRAINQPKVLIDVGREKYGMEDIKRNGIMVKITSLARTVVDVLDRADLGGGWEEIWRSLDHITQLDVESVVTYALLLNNSTTVAKVGYFLEQRPIHYAVDQSQIQKLLPHIPKQPHYMNRAQRGDGKYIERWHLIVPHEIINRTWEEPDVANI